MLYLKMKVIQLGYCSTEGHTIRQKDSIFLRSFDFNSSFILQDEDTMQHELTTFLGFKI